MAPSSFASVTQRLTFRRGLLAFGFALVVPVGACGQVTGLSDDYRFDQLEGGSITDGQSADGKTDGTVGADGSSGGPRDATADAKESCNTTQTVTAQEDLTNANAEIVSACRNCLAGNCCLTVHHCATSNDCDNSMKCVFGCQGKQGNAKTVCLAQCGDVFQRTIEACLDSACSTNCSLF